MLARGVPGTPTPDELMPQVLRRGTVVRRGEHWAMVWTVRTDGRLQLLPIERPEHRRVGQVPIEWQTAALLELPPDSAVEVGLHQVQPADGWQRRGEFHGPLMCAITRAVIVVARGELQERRWLPERVHDAEQRDVSARVRF